MSDNPERYTCPICGTMSDLIIGEAQAFCSNTQCKVISFNPSLPDKGMSEIHEVDLSDLEGSD